uniref:alanine racemase n=1 Tax=Ningiella ruwaisensis TaxID=2364274 RepID=UPI0010A07FDE|nr:alanine racemase [Ningiella ruwaisensis]
MKVNRDTGNAKHSHLSELPTPCLLIERSLLIKNIQRMSKHIKRLNCRLRPHVKTHKSLAIAKMIENEGPCSGITVSTIKEAEYFFNAGYTDILYAVGINAHKLDKVHALMKASCDIKLILDSTEAAGQLIDYAQTHNVETPFKVYIELDVDAHRAGVKPDSEDLLTIASMLNDSRFTTLAGVMTHAGASYSCFGLEAQHKMAIQERDLSLLAARRIRHAGMPCPEVSIGSTPTALALDDAHGITEIRAGVYCVFDLVMSGLGVCAQGDIAISVLGSIIGKQTDKDLALTDAGWMAMSRDRGTSEHPTDYGYGVVCDLHGKSLKNLTMVSANQEHGIIGQQSTSTDGSFNPGNFAIGERVRILPNHACSTMAQFEHFYLIDKDRVIDKVPILRGW